MKNLLLFALCALLLTACEGFGTDIIVDVPANFVPDSTNKYAYLVKYDSGDTTNDAPFVDGQFKFTRHVNKPFVARVYAYGRRFTIVAEEGTIHIDTLGVVSGTELNERLQDIVEDVDRSETDSQVAVAFMRGYIANTNNVVGQWAFVNYLLYSSPTVAQIDSMVAEAPEEYKTLERIKKLRTDAMAKEKTSVGKPYADFDVMSEDGHLQKLSDYVTKGHYAIVDFWASWCGPCRQEIATLKKLREQLGKKVDFVGVAVWDEPADTRRAIDKLQIPWPVIIGTEKLYHPTDLYGISGIPCILLIGPDGTILARGLQGDELVAAVKEHVK